MDRLIKGLHHFSTEVFSDHAELFERLAFEGQSPETLFITCSDSRVVPNLITHAAPGELFILRNAGNLIPPYGAGESGVEATIEYAVRALNVQDIVVCGHSHCGAMAGLLAPETLVGLPAVGRWLEHAACTRQIVCDHYSHVSDVQRLKVATEENVLAQLESLRTHPAVASRLAEGDLRLHGWVYRMETGEIRGYFPDDGQFHAITRERVPRPAVVGRRHRLVPSLAS